MFVPLGFSINNQLRFRSITAQEISEAVKELKKNIYEHEKLKKIERLRHQKPKDFWKLFSKKKFFSNDISTDEYLRYFFYTK